MQGPTDADDSSARRARPTAGYEHAAGDHDPGAGERRHTPPQRRLGASTVCEDLRRSVTASLLGSYEHLDCLERQLAQLRESSEPRVGQTSATSGVLEVDPEVDPEVDAEVDPEVAPVDMRAHIGAALSLVPGLLGAASSSAAALSGTAVLDNLQHNLLVTMETIGELLVEVSMPEGLMTKDVMDVVNRAKAAMDTFVADPAGCEAVHAARRAVD